MDNSNLTISQPLLKAVGLRKRYGEREVVRGLSFELSAGEVVALMGPNGAGKSTGLEIALGLRRADEGTVEWRDVSLRRDVGVQLQTTPVFPGLSALENLELIASLYGLRPGRPALEAVLRRCGLGEALRTDASRLSGGQQKRLSIAMALVHSPRLVILDEPTAALDPRAQAELRDLIRELARSRVAVMFSSHDLREVESLADRVVLIDRGEVLAQGPVAQLLATYGAADLEALYLSLIQSKES